MNTLLKQQFNHDISNLILCELERVKFDEVLTQMSKLVKHEIGGCWAVHKIYFDGEDREDKKTTYVNYEDRDDVHITVKKMGVVLVGYGPGTKFVLPRINWEQVKFDENKQTHIYKCKFEKYETIGEGFDRLRELTEY